MRQLSQKRGKNLYWRMVGESGEYLGNELEIDKKRANARNINKSIESKTRQ